MWMCYVGNSAYEMGNSMDVATLGADGGLTPLLNQNSYFFYVSVIQPHYYFYLSTIWHPYTIWPT